MDQAHPRIIPDKVTCFEVGGVGDGKSVFFETTVLSGISSVSSLFTKVPN